MKVGTVTFHQALNYGAVLQAYALQRAIEDLGHDCEVIDYRCDRLSQGYAVLPPLSSGLRGVVSGIAHARGKLAKHARFNQFRTRHMRISPEHYDRATIGEAEPRYDCFVVGSDQVWNPMLTDGDDTYFLGFCGDPRKKVAYAPSLGRSHNLSRFEDVYERYLPSFRALSVRESDGSQYLSSLLRRDVPWVVDPVFLLSTDEWGTVASKPDIDEPYIFAYCLHETSLYRHAEHLSEATGMRLVYVPESLRTRADGRRVTNLRVEEFLGWIQGAECVITDSFHALAFGLIFHRDFRAQLKRRFPELNSRLTSLIDFVCLGERVLHPDGEIVDVLPRVDYCEVDRRLGLLVERSKVYLRAALDARASES